MNLVSELVLARNRLLPFVTDNTDLNFASAVRTIDILTLELQERMMKTRMQPISQVWGKFPRLVRDLSTELGKKVELIQEGAETELDRTLLEAIRDPLVHIVRNTVDHGIELPNVRRVAKKPETGRLVLRARHENGMVVIEVIDDGAGINVDRVRQKAIDRGLVKAEVAATMRQGDADVVGKHPVCALLQGLQGCGRDAIALFQIGADPVCVFLCGVKKIAHHDQAQGTA
jgi:two-component system chemotaxis sensor kinase CheA